MTSGWTPYDHVSGRYEPIRIARRPIGQLQPVYWGERLIGQVGPEGHKGHGEDAWTAISSASSDELQGMRMVRGFRTRWQAVEYLLQVIRPPEEDPPMPPGKFEGTGWRRVFTHEVRVHGREVYGMRPSVVTMLLGPKE